MSENKLIYMDIFQQYTDLIGTSCAKRCFGPGYYSPSDVAYLHDCTLAETFIERRLHEKLEVKEFTNDGTRTPTLTYLKY